jgi:uncharacterized protein YydD (DUF2326 family)
MIHSVKANKPSFKATFFTPGFNVVLADKTRQSSQKDSRNGLGKSTLIEIIHFCLGASKGRTLQKPELNDWTFYLDISINNKRYIFSRNTFKSKKIIIEGDCSDWLVRPSIDKETGKQLIKDTDLNRELGHLFFDLQLTYNIDYSPSFRSLISYFIRRNGQSGGFLNPFQHFKSQKEWDIQVHNAFLLGLGWKFAARLQVLKDKKHFLDHFKREAKTGYFTNFIGSLGEIDANRIRLEARVNQQERDLSNFNVHPEYREIEKEADQLTIDIHNLVNNNIIDNKMISNYINSQNTETDTNPDAIKKIYQEAGVIFPESINKRLSELVTFNEQLIFNRKEYLNTEIERLKAGVTIREQDVINLSTKKMELMNILQSHGALDEYMNIQKNYQKNVSELNEFKIRLENIKKFEQGSSDLKIEREHLLQQANLDLEERKQQRERAIILFNNNSEALYEAPGTLSIDFGENGFKFNVDIKRSASHGIGNMKIFCYDIMMAELWSKIENSPGLLIHDSILFADVDERQRALALEMAVKQSEKNNFQYICTINSDNVPNNSFDSSFNFDKYIIQRLTDATEDGGLLGIRI